MGKAEPGFQRQSAWPPITASAFPPWESGRQEARELRPSLFRFHN